ncbi:FAD binding domain-containing protein [Tabrizicola sp. KVB23]|uniref:FAD binding domain-containing protein n=2 Tax=Fuscibacter oryzae TaxID=2803939 RepID=A0A8J7MVC1_9RHOB|nr:FAD binding domain-containing protein [Fuscibacter oryzae]
MAGGGWDVLAGGTDVYPGAGAQLRRSVVDVTGIVEMQGITQQDGLRIGGAVTWAEIAATPLPAALAGLQRAAVQVGGRQVQNVGTIAGNLCNASPAADGVPPLLTLDAVVELDSANGRRDVPLAEFILAPRRTDRRPDELVVAVRIPQRALGGKGVFLKLGARAHLVISIASVAVRCVTNEGIVTEIMIAAGACSPVPCRLPIIEAALLGAPVAGLAGRIRAEGITASLSPIDDVRAPAGYRLEAVAELLRRALEGAAG